MNILGVGMSELLVILLIMLIFAGPKRMILWANTLGRYVAKFRRLWAETVDIVQKEFDEAGVGIQLPKEPPTRANLNRALTDAAKPLTQPMQSTLNEVQKDLNSVKEVSDTLNNKAPTTRPSAAKTNSSGPRPAALPAKRPAAAKAAPSKPALKPPQPAEAQTMGTWGGRSASAVNGQGADLGSWSKNSAAE